MFYGFATQNYFTSIGYRFIFLFFMNTLFVDFLNETQAIITSQLPVKQWHEVIGEKTIADAILT